MSRQITVTLTVLNEDDPDALLEALEQAAENSEVVTVTPCGKDPAFILINEVTAESWTRVTSQQIFG